MRAVQQIYRSRRQYNQWVGNQTLEDYSLRFTATKGRRWPIERVAQTALGATAFLALEALSATITLQYGFANTFWAILAVSFCIILTGLPICYYAAKFGLDIDLLTRASGFGYLGSTFTSLIYATFTFIFFAIEAAILASAFKALLGIPLEIGYIICAVIVIPLVTHGIAAISKFQVGTQGLWLSLQIMALVGVGVYELHQVSDWINYSPSDKPQGHQFNLTLFGAAAAVLFAMIAQIGEQVDYLRFLPEKTAKNAKRWWFWLLLAGPGWILIGIIKMLLGSFIAYIAIKQGGSFIEATDPTHLYHIAFERLVGSPTLALILAGIMVFVSQMKINITNAYAGSIAWSNFFSRLTHSHPGRVIWLVFNVLIALILMEFGIHRALESVLSIFAIIAVSWLATVAADLLINRPLKLRPAHLEFKRSHLYDINPVGVGSMLIASVIGIVCYLGYLGDTGQALAHFISLAVCFLVAPLIAWVTQGRFYHARNTEEEAAKYPIIYCEHEHNLKTARCCICETDFESQDMSFCPAYQGSICSLCCSLDARCLDSCKPHARLANQALDFFRLFLPDSWALSVNTRIGQFLAIFTCINLFLAGLLALIHIQLKPQNAAELALLDSAIWSLFFILMIIFGVIIWLFLLAHESRESAQEESNLQTRRLIKEIEAHKVTDASLQKAKEIAESANQAKTRYLTGISHELRTPLQAVLGYTQLLTQDKSLSIEQKNRLKIIHRNGDYLSDLIEGLLDLSKIEAGKIEIYRNEINLPELLDQLVQMFAPQAQQKNIEFHYLCQEHLPRVVMGDEKRIRQVLINLLSNAIKYTERGIIEFSVSYRNQVAEFTVKDTGVGIAEKDLERILAPFERITDTNVPNVNGTGLGLTIVNLLTEIMGGNLDIQSTLNLGSTFKASLMLSYVNAPITEPLPQEIIGYLGPKKRVMIVDDQMSHRTLIKDIIQPLNFSTLEAATGEECLTLLKNNTPDIFLLDMSMPGISGLALAHSIRDIGYTCPIIMISADAQERHRQPQDGNPHDDYMVKPINNQALVNKIGHYLRMRWVYLDDALEADGESSPRIKTMHTKPFEALKKELAGCADLGFSKGVKLAIASLESNPNVPENKLRDLHELADKHQYTEIMTYVEQQL